MIGMDCQEVIVKSPFGPMCRSVKAKPLVPGPAVLPGIALDRAAWFRLQRREHGRERANYSPRGSGSRRHGRGFQKSEQKSCSPVEQWRSRRSLQNG
jgi:hypothetical protein